MTSHSKRGGKPGRIAPATADGELAIGENASGSSLESIEDAGDAAPDADPGAARRLLESRHLAFPAGDGEGDAELDQTKDTPAPKPRGRPKGSRNRPKDAPAPRRSSSRESRAAAIERADAAEAKLAAIELANSPDGEAARQQLAGALAGTVGFGLEMLIAADPTREHWRCSESELNTIGDLWATPLLPHLPAVGAAAPWGIAIFGTARIITAKMHAAPTEKEKVPDGGN